MVLTFRRCCHRSFEVAWEHQALRTLHEFLSCSSRFCAVLVSTTQKAHLLVDSWLDSFVGCIGARPVGDGSDWHPPGFSVAPSSILGDSDARSTQDCFVGLLRRGLADGVLAARFCPRLESASALGGYGGRDLELADCQWLEAHQHHQLPLGLASIWRRGRTFVALDLGCLGWRIRALLSGWPRIERIGFSEHRLGGSHGRIASSKALGSQTLVGCCRVRASHGGGSDAQGCAPSQSYPLDCLDLRCSGLGVYLGFTVLVRRLKGASSKCLRPERNSGLIFTDCFNLNHTVFKFSLALRPTKKPRRCCRRTGFFDHRS